MASKTVTLTAQEKYLLASHILGNIIPKDHAEGMLLYDAFNACNLEYYRKIVTGRDAGKANLNDFDNSLVISESLSVSSIAYLLDVLNRPMSGVQALTLVPIAVRLRTIQLDPAA